MVWIVDLFGDDKLSSGKIESLEPVFHEKLEYCQPIEGNLFNLSEIIIPFSEFYDKPVLIEKDTNFKEIMMKEFLWIRPSLFISFNLPYPFLYIGI